MKLREEQKKTIFRILIILCFGSGLVNFIFLMNIFISILNPADILCDECGEALRVARTSNPVTMDPCDSWDKSSNDMLNQLVETLIAYDYKDPSFPLVGCLATSWYWNNNISITFILREKVLFHDGSKFTADCVLHTFERVNYFGNWTGKLPSNKSMASPHTLYKFSDGRPIINHTLSYKTDDYNVTLVLNRPYGPVEGLLAYTASSIVHPDSTPVDEMLDISEDLVIGTGPFKLLRYVPDSQVIFVRWERYWRTGAYWDMIIYLYYTDIITTFHALHDGYVDWLSSYTYPPCKSCYFEPNSGVIVTGNGTSDYIASSTYNYISFNSEALNQTWRKAICHAFNYTCLNRDINEDLTVKANSLVSPGFPAHNSSVIGGSYNIPYARQIMQSMGFGVGWERGTQIGDVFTPGLDEVLWKASQFHPNTWNNSLTFHHRQGSHFHELLIQRFCEDMNLIGIDIVVAVITWDEWPSSIILPEDCVFAFLMREPAYFETYNMIDPLVNPESASNIHKINNPEINALLAQTEIETDLSQRYKLYKKLQYLIHDKFYYHMPLFYNKLRHAHVETLKGFPYNSMRNLYFYPTYREW